MTLTPTIQSALSRHANAINRALHTALEECASTPETADLRPFYGQIHYHLGWVDSDFVPISNNHGKLLRPTLLLLAYEAAGTMGLASANVSTDYLRRALPAAAAVELTHNFTLIHDDIEDGDSERRHRATLWKLWGMPQAINTGDGLFALARLTLWNVVNEGVEGSIAARLGAVLDRACLVLAEGQYLDIHFEELPTVSVAMYSDMISRKTGALMGCATEMGALLGTTDAETIRSLRTFGEAMGIAFQVRDDLLGIWATTAELGKTPSGDIYRRKKSLPFLHSLEHATPHDQQRLSEIYQLSTPITTSLVDEVLSIFDSTHTKAYCRTFLTDQCRIAHDSLSSVPRINHPISARALNDMQTLLHFVEEAAH